MEKEPGRRALLEPAAHTTLHPLAKLPFVADEVGKVGTVPGWDVTFQRSRIPAREAPSGTVAADASELRDALPSTEHRRVFGLRHAVHRAHEGHEIIDLATGEAIL